MSQKEPREQLKVYGVRIGSANKELLDIYCRKHKCRTYTEMAKEIIELPVILGAPIRSKDDVYRANRYAENLLYKDLCEMIEQVIRADIKDDIKICMNCNQYQNGICFEHRTICNKYDAMCVIGESNMRKE